MAEATSEQGGAFYKDGQYTKYAFDATATRVGTEVIHVLGRKSATKLYGSISIKCVLRLMLI